MNFKSLIVIVLTFGFFLNSFSQEEWIVPESKKKINPPFSFNEETQKAGEKIYNINCASCHGNPGKGDFVALPVSPGDPASEKFSHNTDGELYYKIRNGRELMPKFDAILSDEQKWQVISYIRTFHPDYEGAIVEEGKGTEDLNLPGVKNIQLAFEYIEESKKVKILAKGEIEEKEQAITGAEVSLFAKRYFGNLQLGESMETDEFGFAYFDFPADLPGDEQGNIELMAKLNTPNSSGSFQETSTLTIGKITKPENILDQRAMWGTAAKTPVWLLFAYFGVVSIVYSFLAYIVFLLFKINKLGKQ